MLIGLGSSIPGAGGGGGGGGGAPGGPGAPPGGGGGPTKNRSADDARHGTNLPSSAVEVVQE